MIYITRDRQIPGLYDLYGLYDPAFTIIVYIVWIGKLVTFGDFSKRFCK